MSSDADRHCRLLRENGYRVSVFHNPGSLWGTMPARVELSAVKDGGFWMARAYVGEYEVAEYVAAYQWPRRAD